MLRVSVNGVPSTLAESVVLYDDDVPVALGMMHGGVILFCDAIRDKQEFETGLATLGISVDELPEPRRLFNTDKEN